MQRPADRPEGKISIHTPREGSDQLAMARERLELEFQSTLPVRGVTIKKGLKTIDDVPISIHTPREGSDMLARSAYRAILNFNPHSP